MLPEDLLSVTAVRRCDFVLTWLCKVNGLVNLTFREEMQMGLPEQAAVAPPGHCYQIVDGVMELCSVFAVGLEDRNIRAEPVGEVTGNRLLYVLHKSEISLARHVVHLPPDIGESVAFRRWNRLLVRSDYRSAGGAIYSRSPRHPPT